MYRNSIKVGLLGGGQLGRMLVPEAAKLAVDLHILDPDANAPCRSLCANFTQGSLTDYETVYQFGKDKHVITVEIENVNTLALLALQSEGLKVYPQPEVLAIIQDKTLQKQFYTQHNIPTAPYVLTQNRQALAQHLDFLPAVHKLGREGYDGRGVQKLMNAADIEKGFEQPSVLEKLMDFSSEISIIVARNEHGQIAVFPPVAQVLDPVHNLVDYLTAPAKLPAQVLDRANQIATQIITQLEMVGLLAVELFVMPDGQVLVNEIAPRPHNSGHHTIEANVTSQFEQHLRAVLGYPLGSTATLQKAAMLNLLGEVGYAGNTVYQGLSDVLAIQGVYVHLYGKAQTKPMRKMGHITITESAPYKTLHEAVAHIKTLIKVVA
jgi:5-(carboxyamino)imidazole ribonucleotide synthase